MIYFVSCILYILLSLAWAMGSESLVDSVRENRSISRFKLLIWSFCWPATQSYVGLVVLYVLIKGLFSDNR
jgi:hypothetical protein